MTDKNNRNKKKKSVFLRVLLAVLIIGFAYLGWRYCSIHDVFSNFGEKVKESISGSATTSGEGYTNIALFGVDSVGGSLESGNNRSDIMMVASINNKTFDVKLVSLYRDTYLDIGDGTYTKANAAYAYGGAEQAVSMLNSNFDLNISDYVTVGFGGIADIIDALGGIEITVEDEEIHYLNDYQSTMAADLGRSYNPVTTAGTQTLDGLQATAYCRIRYTSGDDFKRTERQRTVLTQTFSKIKNASPVTLAKIAATMMTNGEVKTSLDLSEITEMGVQAGAFNVSDTTGMPPEELRTLMTVDDQSCIVPNDLASTVVWLHSLLFGETDYQVSETVQAISDQIKTNAGL